MPVSLDQTRELVENVPPRPRKGQTSSQLGSHLDNVRLGMFLSKPDLRTKPCLRVLYPGKVQQPKCKAKFENPHERSLLTVDVSCAPGIMVLCCGGWSTRIDVRTLIGSGRDRWWEVMQQTGFRCHGTFHNML